MAASYTAAAIVITTHDHQAQRDAASPRSVLAFDVPIGTLNTVRSQATKVENKSWKSVSGKPFPAIATCFWKIERAVWSSGNIPFTVLTSFNFKVVIAERITMESQKKKNLVNLAAGNRAQHIQSYLSN